MKLSFRLYAFCSVNAFLALIVFLFIAHESLYHALYFLCTEQISIVILTNFAFMMFFGISRFFVSFFLGPLRDFEVEQVLEVGRGFLLDTVMFLVLSSPTIDDEEVSTRRILQFVGFVVAFKLFHVITQTRVAHFFESRIEDTKTLTRLFGLIVILTCADIVAVRYFFKYSHREASLYLWLFFECVGMTACSLTNFAKFCIRYIDSCVEGGWPASGTIIFFLNVLNDVLSLAIFLVFMIVFIISHPNRLPIHMTSDILLVGKALFVKLRSFQRYRELMREMSKRFPEATDEELENAETCIICRDILYVGSRKLPCGHIFHVECLKAWFVQQQSCPTCRANVMQATAQKRKFSYSTEETVPQSQDAQVNDERDNESIERNQNRKEMVTKKKTSSSAEGISHYSLELKTSESSNFHNSSSSSCSSLEKNDSCMYIVYKGKSRPSLNVAKREPPKTCGPNRYVTTFVRQLFSKIIPKPAPKPFFSEILTQDRMRQISQALSRFNKSSSPFITVVSHHRKRALMRRSCYSSQHFFSEKKKLKESMDVALKMTEYFRQESLYWYSQAYGNKSQWTPTNHAYPFPLTSPLFNFPNDFNFQSILKNSSPSTGSIKDCYLPLPPPLSKKSFPEN